ncbi:uncharacterized protein LOC130744016 [Lotus japonicus]|uniref:uncharacterized protein LOC130744016 n=1 Tax=Lotus japonicus TaxID=34305 RepID=UPI002587AE67|nr:uncharacterized protein LOC130744016 [Lotus japonicus]
MASQSQPQETKTLPIKILFDKQTNKVVAVEATNDFVDTLFSFLSLPLGTITRLVTTTTNSNNNNDQQLPEPPFPSSINNLYQSVQNLSPNDVWNPVCKQMLLRPRNPCEALCSKLVLNVDDTEPARKVYVCGSCDKFTTFPNLVCTCGKPVREPHNLDSPGSVEAKGGVFVKQNETSFLVFDDLKIVPNSFVNSVPLLLKMGYSDLTQLEEITQNIGKHEILKILKYALTSHEPLTNAILGCDSKKKDDPLHQFASAVRARPKTDDSKMDVKVVRSKSQNKIIFAEANEDFVDFIFSFLTIPLGSVVKLLGGNSFVGCVDNLYMSVETLDSSWCTDSHPLLLNPGLALQFGCPNQPLNIPDVEPPSYYYGTADTRKTRTVYVKYQGNVDQVVTIEGGVISKSRGLVYNPRTLTALDPRSPNRLKEGVVGFVKRPALYGVGDDLKVKLLSAISCYSYLKELNLPLDDIEVKVLTIGEAEALSLLGASLTSKFTLTSGLEDFLDVAKQGSTLTSKYTQNKRQRLDDVLKEEPNLEA